MWFGPSRPTPAAQGTNRFPLSPVLFLPLMGLLLSFGLHACGRSQPSSPSPTSATTQSTPETPSSLTVDTPASVPSTPAPLSPGTQAIIDGAGLDGVYNPPRGDVRLVVISDLNGAYGSTDYDPEVDKAIALLPFWQPDMVVCSGDMVAGQKASLTDPELQAMWAAFDDHVAAPLRQLGIPYGFTLGNHDASGALNGAGSFAYERERTVAADYWNNPAHDPGIEFIDDQDYPFYYTFRLGDIFFLTWDGSTFKIPPEKLAWVEQSLASPAAQSARMKVLLGHLPLYGVAVGRDKPGEVMADADQLRQMLERHDVHTYISGHQHAYYPAYKGNLQLLHTGLLGSGPRQLLNSGRSPQKTLTVIDIDFDGPEMTTYTTYDIETLELIELEQLPPSITGHNGTVWRRDVEQSP